MVVLACHFFPSSSAGYLNAQQSFHFYLSNYQPKT
jgi:hypothetical protein